MTGFWEADEDPGFRMPVWCNDTAVKTTLYSHPGRGVLVVAANFGPSATVVSFGVDYAALGLDAGAPWHIPAIAPFQQEAPLSRNGTVAMQPQSGGIILTIGNVGGGGE